jgi:hypothetical protein
MLQAAEPTDFRQFDQEAASLSDYNANRYRGDQGLYVQFYQRPDKDMEASQEAGRAIYKTVEYVRISVPGDKTTVIDRPVRIIEDEPSRFPKQYEAFKRGAADEVIGTPLEAMPSLTPSTIEEYKYLKIRTVEALANVPDVLTNQVRGLAEHKLAADRFLAVLESGKDEARDERIAAMEAENKLLRERMDELLAKGKK